MGYYGNRGNELLDENAKAGQGFLSEVCVAWEKEALRFKEELNIPTSIIRVGVILSTLGGAVTAY